MLPKDPFILLSFVNAKLRDEFTSPEELCDAYCTDLEDLTATLAQVGFTYDSWQNQFR